MPHSSPHTLCPDHCPLQSCEKVGTYPACRHSALSILFGVLASHPRARLSSRTGLQAPQPAVTGSGMPRVDFQTQVPSARAPPTGLHVPEARVPSSLKFPVYKDPNALIQRAGPCGKCSLQQDKSAKSAPQMLCPSVALLLVLLSYCVSWWKLFLR